MVLVAGTWPSTCGDPLSSMTKVDGIEGSGQELGSSHHGTLRAPCVDLIPYGVAATEGLCSVPLWLWISQQ